MSRIPDKETAFRCLWRVPSLVEIYEPESPMFRDDIVDSINLLITEISRLQSAHDKLKERIEGAQKTETDENGFIDVNYFLNTNDERQTIALVALTPEEMENNDEDYNAKDSR